MMNGKSVTDVMANRFFGLKLQTLAASIEELQIVYFDVDFDCRLTGISQRLIDFGTKQAHE